MFLRAGGRGGEEEGRRRGNKTNTSAKKNPKTQLAGFFTDGSRKIGSAGRGLFNILGERPFIFPRGLQIAEIFLLGTGN